MSSSPIVPIWTNQETISGPCSYIHTSLTTQSTFKSNKFSHPTEFQSMGVFDSLRLRKVWDVFRKLQKIDTLVEYCLTFIWLVCKQNCDKICNAEGFPKMVVYYNVQDLKETLVFGERMAFLTFIALNVPQMQAHRCTIFLCHLDLEIQMIDIDIQISISERTSGWATNQGRRGPFAQCDSVVDRQKRSRQYFGMNMNQ